MSLRVTRSKERMELAALPRLTFKSRVVRLNTDLQAVEFGECHRNRSLRSGPPMLGSVLPRFKNGSPVLLG